MISDFGGNVIPLQQGQVTQNNRRTPISIEELTRQLQAAAAELNAEPIAETAKHLTNTTFGYGILHLKQTKVCGEDAFVPTSLYNDGLWAILTAAGFAKRRTGKHFVLIRKQGRVLSEVSAETMKDFVTRQVGAMGEGYHFVFQGVTYDIPIEGIREIFFRNSHNIFNDRWLQHLPESTDPVLRDTATQMFFPFRNGLVTVTKGGIALEPWESDGGLCVWENHIIKRDYGVPDGAAGRFAQFLTNVSNNDPERLNAMRAIIGYLMHHYFRESEGQAAILYDEAITDTRRPMGGTGKGLIANALKQVRAVTKIDGKHFEPESRFRWELVSPDTQIVWLDDTKPDFDFATLHSNLTDGWTIERKYLSQFSIPPKDSPKTMLCSNSILQGGGTTNRRRQVAVELSGHYSKKIVRGDEKPIEEEHGGLFFSDESWNAAEWNRFYGTMLECAKLYLGKGLMPHKGINVELNRFRQAVGEEFAEWCSGRGFTCGGEYDTAAMHRDFVGAFQGGERFQTGQRKFTGYIKSYAESKGWQYANVRRGGESFFSFQSLSL